MGEVLPNAIPLMAKAAQDAGLSISGTVKEMMELQQRGELVSSKVLPHFAKRMREAAQANGGLDSALGSNRVAMNRFMLTMQMTADAIFKAGFGEGLTDFFNATATFFKDTMPLWETMGRIIGGALKGIAFIIKSLTPAFKVLSSIIGAVSEALGDFSAVVAFAIGGGLLMKYIGMLSLLKTSLFGVAAAATTATGASVKLNASLMTGLRLIGLYLAPLAAIGWTFNKAAEMGEAHTKKYGKPVIPRHMIDRMQAPARNSQVVNEITLPATEVNISLDNEKVATAVTKSATYQTATENMIRDRTG